MCVPIFGFGACSLNHKQALIRRPAHCIHSASPQSYWFVWLFIQLTPCNLLRIDYSSCLPSYRYWCFSRLFVVCDSDSWHYCWRWVILLLWLTYYVFCTVFCITSSTSTEVYYVKFDCVYMYCMITQSILVTVEGKVCIYQLLDFQN